MQKTRKNATSKKIMGITPKITLPYLELFDAYVKHCKLQNLSETTIRGYEYANKYFLRYVGYDLKCSDVTQELVDDYKLNLINRLKPETVNSYMFKISPIIKYGYQQGYIENDILFTHMKEQEHFKDIYTAEELSILLEKPKMNSFAEYRNWVIINFLLGTGVRAKELRELLIGNIDLNNNIINLNHTKNKKSRVIPISSTLHLILNEYISIRNGEEDDVLFCNQFGEPLCRTTLQMSITKYCKKRGVEKYSLHLFRHTFITLSVRKGVSPLILKRITGHSSFKMLDNYYNANAQDLVNIVDNINPLEDFKPRTKIEMKKKKK